MELGGASINIEWKVGVQVLDAISPNMEHFLFLPFPTISSKVMCKLQWLMGPSMAVGSPTERMLGQVCTCGKGIQVAHARLLTEPS